MYNQVITEYEIWFKCYPAQFENQQTRFRMLCDLQQRESTCVQSSNEWKTYITFHIPFWNIPFWKGTCYIASVFDLMLFFKAPSITQTPLINCSKCSYYAGNFGVGPELEFSYWVLNGDLMAYYRMETPGFTIVV